MAESPRNRILALLGRLDSINDVGSDPASSSLGRELGAGEVPLVRGGYPIANTTFSGFPPLGDDCKASSIVWV